MKRKSGTLEERRTRAIAEAVGLANNLVQHEGPLTDFERVEILATPKLRAGRTPLWGVMRATSGGTNVEVDRDLVDIAAGVASRVTVG